jgi:tetraacyldisaccharide 4'-kinase
VVLPAARQHAPQAHVLAARHVPTECWETGAMRYLRADALRGRRLVAFAGIGSPDGFRRTLGEAGVIEADFARFGDHHWYERDEIRELERRAARLDAVGLVTTEKDWTRLRRLPPAGVPLYVLSVRLALLSGEGDWRAAFQRVCEARR